MELQNEQHSDHVENDGEQEQRKRLCEPVALWPFRLVAGLGNLQEVQHPDHVSASCCFCCCYFFQLWEVAVADYVGKMNHLHLHFVLFRLVLHTPLSFFDEMKSDVRDHEVRKLMMVNGCNLIPEFNGSEKNIVTGLKEFNADS